MRIVFSILGFAVLLVFLSTGCNKDLNQSQNVKIIEERDSIVIINRKGEKDK
jgi:hypothetical protein